MPFVRNVFYIVSILLCASMPYAEDWPAWRYDAYRSANSPQVMPAEYHVQWTHSLPKQEPVWDDPLNRDLMQFDTVYEPIVAGKTIVFGSNSQDRLIALHTDTGEEIWTYYVDGPIRLAPVADQTTVYFACDDGCLYAVNLANGELRWKYDSTPAQRKLLGNERLISTWPARGGPVLEDGIVYFGSGIWPFMGVFVFAIDARTGSEIWVNDSISAPYMQQPHSGSHAFAGIAPQGSMTISGDRLLVSGGRSVPACFDKKTGKFLYFRLSENNKTGGAFVCATPTHYFNYYRDSMTHLYETQTGDQVMQNLGIPLVSGADIYCRGEKIQAFTNIHTEIVKEKKTDRKTKEVTYVDKTVTRIDPLWEIEVDASGDLIKAGNTLIAGSTNAITVIPLHENNTPPTQMQTLEVNGFVKRLIAADNKLFAITTDGVIVAYGGQDTAPQHHQFTTQDTEIPAQALAQARKILSETSIQDGYGFVFGLTDGYLTEALIRQSNLKLIAFDPNEHKVNALRKRYIQAGLYGQRLSVQVGDIHTVHTTPYLASLIVLEDSRPYTPHSDVFTALYHPLRPYGGTLSMPITADRKAEALSAIARANLSNATVLESGDRLHLIRDGALDGAANWTHQYGDVSNTVKSDDQRVKLPLGLLWFGGNSHEDVLPRHGHGPPEQIVDGRLFIEGMDCISARDVYTGRVLWKRSFDDLGNFNVYYDKTYADTPLSTQYNQVHLPGANARGTNFVVTEDTIYLIKGSQCLLLDPVTGADRGSLSLPAFDSSPASSEWGYIGVYQDYLIAGAGFISYINFVQIPDDVKESAYSFYNYDKTSSKRLVVMNRHSGKVVWSHTANLGFIHNAIVAGDGKVFCLDKAPAGVTGALKRRGTKLTGTARLLAFDIGTGRQEWEDLDNVFGTWLGYSAEHDILLQSGRDSRDMLKDEVKQGMIAFQGKTGARLWENNARYSGPCILHHDTIITDPNQYSLLSGEQIQHTNPITHEEYPWAFRRNYGCNYAIACEHFLAFRSGAAGFFDLENNGGTGNFGGFKSGCTSNLIAAGGVLNAPDYTRTCSCSYQNQTSLALYHDPSVEIWTFNNFSLGDENAIQRLGINLGAPGDRVDHTGTLWLEFPVNDSPSPDFQVDLLPEKPNCFVHHSSRYAEHDLRWVGASGVEDIRELTIHVASDQKQRTYTVALLFADPGHAPAAQNTFSVDVQGQTVLRDFNIATEANGIRRTIKRTFTAVEATEAIKIDLAPSKPGNHTLLCGVEIIEESIN